MSKKKDSPVESESASMAFAKKHKDTIIDQFSPTFCFASDEYIFPTSAEEYSKDVLTAKMRHYERMSEKSVALNKYEVEEYALIKKVFFNNGNSKSKFDSKGFADPEVKDYIAYEHLAEAKHAAKRPIDDFLTFNEKRHGYALGSEVPIRGHGPTKEKKVDAPVYVSYVPTEDGAIIRYECFYALSGAIPGTNWLYKLLPEKISKKLDNFAVHAGDWEGVYIKVKIDDEGKATLDHMQTFAHGRSGARKVEASDLNFKDGSPCVYVGSATHPSYTDNFLGRNALVDTVGDTYTLRPKTFVDLSPDVVKPAWTVCNLWGKADLMTSKSDYVKSGKEYAEKQTSKDWLKYDYHPISENRLFRAAKAIFESVATFIDKALGRPPKAVHKPTEVHLEPSDLGVKRHVKGKSKVRSMKRDKVYSVDSKTKERNQLLVSELRDKLNNKAKTKTTSMHKHRKSDAKTLSRNEKLASITR